MVFREDLRDVQQLALALIPIPTALLSLSASFTIIVLVCRSRFDAYKRILIGLSVSDILLTSSLIVAPLLLAPRGDSSISKNGNQATCNISGVLAQLGVISNSFYSGFLAVYFYCTVRLGWSPSRFARVVEPVVHGTIITFAVMMSAISLGLKAFRKAQTAPGCWITDEYLSLSVVFMVMICLTCGVILAANLAIYLHVKSVTKKSLRRSMSPSVATNRKHLVATQSFCYVAAYAVTYAPSFIMGLHEMSGGLLFRSNTTYFVFDVLYVVLLPLTGFLNLMVFLRPQYLQFREQHPNASKWLCFQLSLSHTFARTRRRRPNFKGADRVQVPQQESNVDSIAAAEEIHDSEEEEEEAGGVLANTGNCPDPHHNHNAV